MTDRAETPTLIDKNLRHEANFQEFTMAHDKHDSSKHENDSERKKDRPLRGSQEEKNRHSHGPADPHDESADEES